MKVIRIGLIGLLLAACGGDDGGGSNHLKDAPGTGGDGGGDTRETVVNTTLHPKLDLLVVVDDSSSMADKQTNLAANFPQLINVLSGGTGGLPDLHLGVITTDMGTKASGSATPGPSIGTAGNGGCVGTGKGGNLQTGSLPLSGGAKFIFDTPQADGTRVKNYPGELATAFSTMAHVGSTGCGFEQPLASIRTALDASNTTNTGFLRSDALLAIVILTDEDDCSVTDTSIFSTDTSVLGPLQSFRCTRYGVTCDTGGTNATEMNTVGSKTGCHDNTGSQLMDPVGPYHDFLVGLKGGDATRVVVSAIAAPIDPFGVELRAPGGGGTAIPALAHSCTYIDSSSATEVGDPAVRLKTFLDLFPNHSTFTTVCQQDLSDGLQQIGDLTKFAAGTLCLSGTPADVDSGTAGTQTDCVVQTVTGGTPTTVPSCSAGAAETCWSIQNAATCPGPGLELAITTNGVLDPGTVIQMRCTLQH